MVEQRLPSGCHDSDSRATPDMPPTMPSRKRYVRQREWANDTTPPPSCPDKQRSAPREATKDHPRSTKAGLTNNSSNVNDPQSRFFIRNPQMVPRSLLDDPKERFHQSLPRKSLMPSDQSVTNRPPAVADSDTNL
jgi:hypothetical protein